MMGSVYFNRLFCVSIVSLKEYVLRVQRGLSKENTWRVLRRYNEFLALHKELQISGIELPLPGKKIVGKLNLFF